MQIGSIPGASAVYAAAMKAPAAKVNPELNGQATQAAAQAQAAMAGLVQATSGASEAISNIASGQLSNIDMMA